jgi:hypothetical protein
LQTNASDLQTNASDLQTNASDLQTNASDLQTNASDLQTNASDLQTNNGHISKWDHTRESEFTKILMSKSIRYCYKDTSYADPDKGTYMQFHNGLQFDLTDSKTPLPHPELIRGGGKVMIRDEGKVMISNHPTTSYAGPDRTKGIYWHMSNEPQISPRWNLKRGTDTLAPLSLTAQHSSTANHPRQSAPSAKQNRTAIGSNSELGPKSGIDVLTADFGTRILPDSKFNELYSIINSDTHF